MLRLRVATAAILIPILVVVLWYGEPALAVVIALVVLLAGFETADLLRRAGMPVRTPVLVGLAFFAIAEAFVSIIHGDLALAKWVVAVLVISAAVFLLERDPRQALLGWAGTVLGALYVGMLAFLLRISLTVVDGAAEGPLATTLDPGRAWLLILVLGVWAYDTGAYVVGRIYGRGSFFAHISPHKTVTGALGGSVATVVVCALLGAYIGRPFEAAVAGGLIALGAPIGDLSESILKRAAGVKDSGQLIPGHGGMLDRADSFIVAAPLVWLYLATIGLA